MNYNLPFRATDKVIELGGGDRPAFRPNVDMRPGPFTDIVADLNEPLPIKNDEWDGLFCSYMIEHISWRKIRDFIAECFRILRPGGTAVFVTANLLEQARHLINQVEWEDTHVCMIFGDQNYEGEAWRANAHYTGFSPEFASRLLQKAGFDKIMILPWGELRTDMIIEATKPIDRAEMFDKHYFHGGAKVGGYAHEGYRDFLANWAVFERVAEKEPKSILEIGAARGYLLKRFQDKGVPVQGLEISRHCHLTRAIKDITCWDICNTPWPILDKSFDLLFSNATLEHIPEEHLPAIFKEMERVSHRGFHGIDFGEKDDGFDKTHCTLKSPEWWAERMPQSQEFISKHILETPKTSVWDCLPAGDNKLKVQVGSFINMAYHGWINLDVIDLRGFAATNGYKFFVRDAREGLPFEDSSVDLMFASHFLEHLTYEEGRKFLGECKRVLKKGAIARFIMPDAELLMALYKNAQLDCFNEINDGAACVLSQVGKLWAILFAGHKAAYDWDTIKRMAAEVGLNAEKKAFREGHPQILAETIDMLPELSLFVELSS
jgi:predicted SAM-dependent methyltransferase